MRKFPLLWLLVFLPFSAFGAESLQINAATRDVINTGNVNFHANQLLIDGIVVGTGGGGGGGTINTIALTAPSIFNSPINFTIDGSGNATAALTYANQPAQTFFGNVSSITGQPSFMTASQAKVILGLNAVENTALSTWTGSSFLTNLGDVVTGSILADLIAGSSGHRLPAATFPAFSGDVASTAGSTVLSIGNDAVTYAKMQNVSAAGKILGRFSGGSGDPQELTIGPGLSLDGSGNLTSTSSGGTVTNFTAGTLSPLFTTAVATSGTTPALSFSLNSAAANTFFANGTGSNAPPSFVSASTALTALGGTTVGQNFFKLANPSLVTWPRMNVDNTVSALTAGQTVSAIGAEPALGNPGTNNYVLSSTTAGIRSWIPQVGGSSSVSSGTIPAVDNMLALYSGASGTLIKGANGLGSGMLKINSGVATAGTAQIDYVKSLTGGFTNSAGTQLWAHDPTTAQVVTLMSENVALTATRFATLPPAVEFGPGSIITYTDAKTTGSFGRQFHPQGSTDTLNGLNAATWGSTWYAPFIAGGYNGEHKSISFRSDGTSAWEVVTDTYYARAFADPTDESKRVNVDVSLQTPGTVRTFRPATNGDSGSVIDYSAVSRQKLNSYDATTGLLTSDVIYPGDLQPVIDDITSDVTTHTVPIDGTISTNRIDVVRLSSIISSGLTITWAHSSAFPDGGIVRFYDDIGALSPSNPLTITGATVSGSTDTFNHLATVTTNQPNAILTLISNGGGNWDVGGLPAGTGGIDVTAFAPVTEASGILTWNTQVNKPLQVGYATLTGNDTIAVNGPQPGMVYELIVKQDGTGGRTLAPPAGSLTASGGAGVLTIASSPNQVSKVTGTYTGVSGIAWLWDVIENYTAQVLSSCNTLGQTIGAWTTASSDALGANSGTSKKWKGTKFTATATSVCKITAPLYKVGTPTGAITAYIYSDGAPGPGTQLFATGTVAAVDVHPGASAETAADALTHPTTFNFSTTKTLTASTAYYLVLACTTNQSANYYVWGGNSGSNQTYYSLDGIAWTTTGQSKTLDGKLWGP